MASVDKQHFQTRFGSPGRILFVRCLVLNLETPAQSGLHFGILLASPTRTMYIFAGLGRLLRAFEEHPEHLRQQNGPSNYRS